jgi:DNA-3-methyladenine glycosylase I
MADSKKVSRCSWVSDDPLILRYHDREWGTPVHDDRRLFGLTLLEGAQAGLNWMIILRRREAYRAAFVTSTRLELRASTAVRLSRLCATSRLFEIAGRLRGR